MVSPTLERFLNESLTVHYNRAHVYTHAHAEMLDRKNLAQVKKSHNETRLVLSTHYTHLTGFHLEIVPQVNSLLDFGDVEVGKLYHLPLTVRCVYVCVLIGPT